MVARLRLAALWAFGSEILLWTLPERTALVDGAAAALGYLALAALLLDLGVRFRVRGVYGLLGLAGIYALGYSLLINPASAFADLPRTLFTRVLGANALIGLGGLLILILTGTLRPRRPLLPSIGAAALGTAWGMWARWSPAVITGRLDGPEAPLTLAVALAVGLLAVFGALRLMRAPEADLRLSPLGWTLTLGGLLAALILRLAEGTLSNAALSFTLPLILICLGILYWQRRRRGIPLLGRLASPAVPWRTLIGLALMFSAGAGISVLIPRSETAPDPLFAITLIFTAYGFVWLPTVAVVIAVRGLGRMLRAGHL
jgi:hypothetical protein